MTPALVVARMTVLEASRRRLLLAVVILTLIVMAGSGFAVWKIMGLRGPGGALLPQPALFAVVSQLEILLMFMFAGLLALTAAFIGAPSVSSDLESGVSLAMLTRPIRRSEVLLGKWLGLALVTCAFTIGAIALDFVMIWMISGYRAPHPILAVAFVAWDALILLSLAVALSTRLSGITGGVAALGGYMLAWMGGIAGGIGAAFQSPTIQDIGRISRLLLPTDGLWHGAMYAMEPTTLIAEMGRSPQAASNPFFAVSPPPNAYLAWCAAWVVIVLALAALSFHRRQI